MKRLYMTILSILCSIGIAIAISYAWFVNSEMIDPSTSGYSASAYFAYGDGSSGKPFGIRNKRHLYNLAWLVYLYPDNYADLHYELATDIPNDQLDMENMVLPPIGTKDNPFIGYFNGNNNTIKNLIVSNSVSEMTTKPSNLSDKVTTVSDTLTLLNDSEFVGFFGSIEGAVDNQPKVYDFCLDGVSVHTKQSALIGIVAGYVDAQIENIGVVQSGLNLGTGYSAYGSYTNLSDYTVVGYATDDYTTKAYNKHTIIYNPNTSYSHFNYGGMGGANAWGGSMNFSDMFARYQITRNSSYISTSGSGYNFDYVYQEVIKADGSSYTTGGTRNSSLENYSNSSEYFYQRRYLDTGADYDVSSTTTPDQLTDAQKKAANGKYKRALRNGTSSDPGTGTGTSSNSGDARFNYINSLYKDVYTITPNGFVKTGYKIHDGNDHYLGYNCPDDEYITTDEEHAAIWLLDSSGGLYTYDQEEYSTTIIRYLNGTTDLTAALSSTRSTSWSWDNTYSTFKYKNGTTWYYLVCENGNYRATSDLNYYIITDGTNYLVNNNGTISSTTTKNNASVWSFSNNGTNHNGVLTDINSGKKLAINGNNLTTNNSGTNWSYDGTNLFNGNKVIKFNGSNWILETQSSFLIHYGDHYLINTLGDTQTKSDATSWTFSNDLYDVNGSGNISYTSNSITYYLNYKSSDSRLEVTQSNTTTWNHDQYGIYYNDGGTKYYIQYDSGWKAKILTTTTISGYYISYNGNYLTADLSNEYKITNSTSQDDATLWVFSNPGTYPSGTISTVIDGVTYYVNAPSPNNSYVEMSTTAHSFSNSYNELTDSTTSFGIDGYRGSSGSEYWHTYNSNNLYTMTVTSGTKTIVDSNVLLGEITFSTNYVSRCDQFIGLIKLDNITYDYISTKTTTASEFNYVPLITNQNGNNTTLNVSDNNTGYLIGGSHETGSGQKADIRVSEYYMSNISSSVNIKNNVFQSFKDNSIRTVYRNGNSNNIATITDSTATISNTSISLERYSKAKTGLQQIFKDQKNIYGLHFMQSTIQINHLVTAPVVYINGTYYTNYQMPEDCIDFRLAQAGYITFFAGSYFNNNNSFFSLNSIERDSNNKITAIRHIYYIYEDLEAGDNDPKYVYVYEGGTDSYSNNTTRYTKKYDYRTIERPGTSSNLGTTYIYYFEIPVNSGEFALGSVTGRTGAYLFYLDIGANAAPIDRTIVAQKTETIVQTYQFVNGIQILDSASNSINAWDSCVATIPALTSGAINVSRTNNNSANDTISFSQGLVSSYIGNEITASSLTLTAVDTDTGILNILKYIDYDIAKERLYITTIENDGETNTSYKVIRLLNDNGTYKEYEIINDSITSKELIEAAEYGLVDNDGNQVYEFDSSKNIKQDFTIVSINVGTNPEAILDYSSGINTQAVNNAINQTINLTPVRVTGTDATLGITNGKKTITIGTGANAENVELEHVYKLDGNNILISAPGISTFIKTTATVSSSYNCYVNGKRLVASTKYSIEGNVVYQTTSDTTIDSDKCYYIKTELYEISNSTTPSADGLYELSNGNYVTTSDASNSSDKIYFEKKDNYIPAVINDIITSINTNPTSGGYYEITNDYSAE